MINFAQEAKKLKCHLDYEILQVEPWGPNGIRVRATRSAEIKQDWISALLPPGIDSAKIRIHEKGASLQNGSLVANVSMRRFD